MRRENGRGGWAGGGGGREIHSSCCISIFHPHSMICVYVFAAVYYGDWYEHVTSWYTRSQGNRNILIVKYEDMKRVRTGYRSN